MEKPEVSKYFIILQGDEFCPKRAGNCGRESACAAFRIYMEVNFCVCFFQLQLTLKALFQKVLPRMLNTAVEAELELSHLCL